MLPRPLARWNVRRILVTLAIGGVGAYVAYVGAGDLYTGVRSDAWPTVVGTVLEAELVRVPGRGRVSASYKAHVLYGYEVGRQRYTGDRISFGRLAVGSGRDDAEVLLQRYRRGSVVQVHYDPARQNESALETGWTWSAVVRTSLGILVLVGAMVLGRRGRGLTSA